MEHTPAQRVTIHHCHEGGIGTGRLIVALILVIGAATACGSTAATSIKARPPIPRPSPSASPAPAQNAATRLMLNEEQVGIGFEPRPSDALSQVSDGLLSGQDNTDNRVFRDSANQLHIEDALVVKASQSDADFESASARDDGVKRLLTTVASHTMPSIGGHADEFVGIDAQGDSTVGISFQEGNVLGLIIVSALAATVPTAYVEAFAMAQDEKIRMG